MADILWWTGQCFTYSTFPWLDCLYFGFLLILFKKPTDRIISFSLQLPLAMVLERAVLLPMASCWGTGRVWLYTMTFLVIHQLHSLLCSTRSNNRLCFLHQQAGFKSQQEHVHWLNCCLYVSSVVVIGSCRGFGACTANTDILASDNILNLVKCIYYFLL